MIAATEVTSKVSTRFMTSELNIAGYQKFHNIEFKGERGVIVYVSSILFSNRVKYVRYI
jgi:hypothetical protein